MLHEFLKETLSCLVDAMFLNLSKKEIKEYKKNYTKLSFINEFSTIRVSTYRQAGHTTAAEFLLKKYNINCLYVVHKLNNFKLLKEVYPNSIIQFSDTSDFYNKILQSDAHIIIFDTSFYLTENNLKFIKLSLPYERHDSILVLLQ